MNALVYLVGLLGGLVTTGMLRIPLYNYLPGLVVSGWSTVDSRAALFWLIAAGVMTVITGGVAALVSGTKRTGEAVAAGAVAGFIVAVLSQAAWLGPAMGVMGARSALATGLEPIDETRMVVLLVENILSLALWNNVSAWGWLMIGCLLGAIGGLLAGPGGRPNNHLAALWPALSLTGTLVFFAYATVLIAVLALLPEIVQNAADETGYTPSLPPEVVIPIPPLFGWLGLYFVWHLINLHLLKSALAWQVPNRRLWQLAGYINGATMVALAIRTFSVGEVFSWYFYLPSTAGVILGGLAILRAWRLRKLASIKHSSLRAHSLLVVGALTAGVFVALVYSGAVDFGLNLVFLLIPMISYWVPEAQSGTFTTLPALVQASFTWRPHIFGYVLILALVVAAAALILLWIIDRLIYVWDAYINPPGRSRSKDSTQMSNQIDHSR